MKLFEIFDEDRSNALRTAMQKDEKYAERERKWSEHRTSPEMQARKEAAAKIAARKHAEHLRRMEEDPAYRADQERKGRESAEGWASYGKEREKSSKIWTGD